MPEAKTTANPPSFESVWAILDRVAERQEELAKQQKEAFRGFEELKETQKETFRGIAELKESHKETERVLKESKKTLDKQIGSLTDLFGDFSLGMVAPKLRVKFMEYGLVFLESSPNVDVTDRVNKISLEIDIFLKNSDKAMLVEVKTKLTKEWITKHIERLEKMRKYADLHGDKRTFLGAVAGFAISDEVRKTALEEGLYVIEPDGENFNVTPPDDKPKEW